MDIKIPETYSSLFDDINGIVKYPDIILRTSSKNVSGDDNIDAIISKMDDALNKTSGIGLAAPQIGVNQRIIFINTAEKHIVINPVILEKSGQYVSHEGCLSIPGLWGKVIRYKNVVLGGLSPSGKEIIVTFENLEAAVAQHEIDHLNGVLFFDNEKAIPDSFYWQKDIIGRSMNVEYITHEQFPQNEEAHQ